MSMKRLKLRAYFDNGVVCEWWSLSWKAAKRRFNMIAQFEGHGKLYLEDKFLVRESGKNN